MFEYRNSKEIFTGSAYPELKKQNSLPVSNHSFSGRKPSLSQFIYAKK
jgi:hypothetical protein